MIKRNRQDAKLRAAERRLREDQAPRLIREVRRLTSLDIKVEHAGIGYLWRIVVDKAPALFQVACPDESCTEGGHDITAAMMQGLRATSTTFEGESVCKGTLPTGPCSRVVKYVAKATYGRKGAPAS